MTSLPAKKSFLSCVLFPDFPVTNNLPFFGTQKRNFSFPLALEVGGCAEKPKMLLLFRVRVWVAMIYAAIKGGQGRERRGAKRPPPILSLMFFRICIQTGSPLPTSKKGPANCFASSKEITKQIVLNFRLSQLSTCIFRPKYFAFLAFD